MSTAATVASVQASASHQSSAVLSRAQQLHDVLHRSICAQQIARIEELRAIAEIDRDRHYLQLG
jgi:hypothetical protein